MANIIFIDSDEFKFIDRSIKLFEEDIEKYNKEIKLLVNKSCFLVLGGAGSIGQATIKEIFKLNPKKLYVVDISENGLAELVRDLRSSYGYISGEFKTFCLDIGTVEFEAFFKANNYDYVLNFSALKHVRSEKDPFTLMRMIEVNILNTEKTLKQSIEKKVKKYFCVSTDKATKPINLMGASKRIMELFLMRRSLAINVSTARFANVLFSDGSLPQSFLYRIQKRQPLAAPNDVKRFFVAKEESGKLCLLSCLLGENRDIFIPKPEKLKAIGFDEIAIKLLEHVGYEPYFCQLEEEARELIKTLPEKKKWPCYFSKSDTTGEKEIEEFYSESDVVDFSKFEDVGIIKNDAIFDTSKLDYFVMKIEEFKKGKRWRKQDLVELFFYMLDELDYKDVGKYLDNKM